jgi:flagellar hook-associated protein 2
MSNVSAFSGLSSGIDWRNILDQLKAVDHRRIDLVEARQKTYQDRLSAWQAINTKLLSLKTAAETVNETTGFSLYTTSLSSDTTTDAEDVFSVTAGTDAGPGTYQIKVTSLATAQKLSSTSYASQSTTLNLSGDLIIGGRTVKITTTDTLIGIRDKINAVNTGTEASGVTASIVNYGTSGTRLILTSDEEGADGISLLNGGATDLVGALGFVDSSAKTAKNAITGGNQSDAFSAADKAIGGADLLDLTDAPSGTVTITINGTSKSVAVNLATDSLNTIRDAINTAFSGVFSSNPASVGSATEDGTTRYRLLIEGGTLAYTDANNVLETLGVLKRAGVSDERGVTGDVANTSGGAVITSSTLIKDIDGYNNYASGDTVTLTGTSTSGGAVNSVFTINDTTTVGDLLSEIQAGYGDVTAQITADGKIRVVDNEIGDTHLSVTLTPSRSGLSFDQDASFGAIATIRSRQVQAGTNAEITVDGVTVTPSSNTVDDVITGVTLNLKKADPETTVTLSLARDTTGIEEKIESFVTAYNDVIDAISTQQKYDADKKQPGGPLFGDSTLRTIKSNLVDLIIKRVPGVDEDFSTLGLIGINIGNDSKLTIDNEELQDHLGAHFEEVKKLFAADWSSTNSHLSYNYHTIDTKAGTYNVTITGLSPVTGYFVTPGDATGEGEYLTGTSGDAKGLLVRYSGTATGNVGSLTLTFGVAELLNRSLYHITDSVDGLISNKTETIQKTITKMDENMAKMEDRLTQKMAVLERQFIAMETALSQFQTQSNWLTQQIDRL